MNSTSVPTSLVQRLREGTRVHHQRAEERRLERGLAAGTLPREVYVRLLEQRYLVHDALERALRSWRGEDPRRGDLVQERWFQAPRLRADLAHFGVETSSLRALGSTSRLTDFIARAAGGWGLLGVHYVLEGSKNGARFIAPAVRRAYGFSGEGGVSYLDPHGDQQPAFWADFKRALDALRLDVAGDDAVLAGAAAAFEGISEIDEELYPEPSVGG